MYNQKSYEEIFEDMLNDSLEKGLISHADEFQSYIENHEDISNYYVMDKSVIAKMFAIVYEDLTEVHNSVNVNIATGEDLDNLGDLIGVKRPFATYAMCEVTFKNGSHMDDILIEDELIISTNNGIKYRTLEPVYIPFNKSECNVQCIALEAGVKSKVVENTLKNIENNNGYNLTCNNPVSSSGGTEAYNDDEYRELLKNWKLIYLKGSKEAYDYYFATFDGLDGYKLIPNWDGAGTLKIVMDPGTSFQLNQAYNDIQENISQVMVDVSLFSPNVRYIDVYAVCNVDIDRVNPYSIMEKSEIQSKIVSAIKLYIDGGYRKNGDYYPGLMIGEEFIPHKLSVFLDDEVPELKNIEYNYPDDYIQILDEEIAVSQNVTVEMI